MKASNKDTFLQPETVNSISHAAGLLFGLICIPYLITVAAKNENGAAIFATCVYGFGFLTVFTFSTLYHSFQEPGLKRLLKIFDHISIYFLIAGTYTPFIIIFVNNGFGMFLLITIWVLTLGGTFFKIFYTGRFETLSVAIYLLMGMLLLAGGRAFFIAMPFSVAALIVSGGALYCTGVIFYVWKKYTYHHGIWHVFVLAAAVCHYIAVLKALTYNHY